ncbi:helix-turn-helix transcriptional regulator [Candidatus Amarobacter glycogenicus]|uniref:response regulator transcription factor n=1 Tax=Candidatus Amarobacter glycogenicus TaxID=3140699 RepID=UPI0031CCC078
MALVAEGKSNAQIAMATGLSPSTVKDYVANACHKLGVEGRVGLAVWWIERARDRVTPADRAWPFGGGRREGL